MSRHAIGRLIQTLGTDNPREVIDHCLWAFHQALKGYLEKLETGEIPEKFTIVPRKDNDAPYLICGRFSGGGETMPVLEIKTFIKVNEADQKHQMLIDQCERYGAIRRFDGGRWEPKA
jgi:hypothetical protein